MPHCCPAALIACPTHDSTALPCPAAALPWLAAGVLGVAKPSRTTLSILLSPVGPYFPTGLQPISLFVDEQHRWEGQ